MEFVTRLFLFALINFVLSMIIAPPEIKNDPKTNRKRVWFTRYTLLSFNVLVFALILYFILDASGWK